MTPEEREQYRREFEELEAGSAPSHGSAFAPFDRSEEADAFVRYLEQSAGIVVEAARVASTRTASGYFDIVVKDGKAFEVKLLYRLFERGIRIEDIPDRSPSERSAFLRDHLHGQATVHGGWHATPATAAQLAWYGEVAKLEPAQIQQTVHEARVAYLSQQKSEGSMALWIAGVVGLVGGLIWFAGHGLVGGGLVGTAVVFGIFSATRQRS